MSTRKPAVGGNWKMNLDLAGAAALAKDVAEKTADAGGDVIVFPGLVHLPAVAEALAGTSVRLGAQDFFHAGFGAYTGEVCLPQLRDVGVTDVLVGHSERRHVLGESDKLVNAKTIAGLEAGCTVTLCVGETLEQREAGQTDAVNLAQLVYGLAGVTAEQLARVIVAYEPVWAIGTGRTASPDDAQSAHAAIRRGVGFLYGDTAAAAIRIQYGGSVKPGNAAELFAQPDIDGGLIGGASLKAGDFAAIVAAAG